MEYDPERKIITLDRELSRLDKLVLRFISIVQKHVKYVIISGYISILLGRSRATEDVDVFIQPLSYNAFVNCINAEAPEDVYSCLKEF